MTLEIDELGRQSHTVFVACESLSINFGAQGVDSRAVVIGMTAYLGRLLAHSALPGELGSLLKAVQASMAEQALAAGEILGNG
jgi:hypothetical protein